MSTTSTCIYMYIFKQCTCFCDCWCILQVVSAVSWEGCGHYLASSGIEGRVCVWDFPQKTVCGRYIHVYTYVYAVYMLA